MAQSVGLDRVEVGIPFTPPRSLVRGIVVNAKGERFLNEDTYAGRLGQEFLLRQDGQVYFVHDDSTFAVNIAGYKPKWVAETAAELEDQIGLPAGSSQATLDRYNESARAGADPDFHKASEWVTPLEPPYGVVDLRVEKSFYAPFTLGGLATDADSRVLDDRRRADRGALRRRSHHRRHRGGRLRQRHPPRRRHLLRPPGRRHGGAASRLTIDVAQGADASRRTGGYSSHGSRNVSAHLEA